MGRRSFGTGRPDRIGTWALFHLPSDSLRSAPGGPSSLGAARAPRGTPERGRENQENMFAVRWGVLPLVLLLQEVGRHAVFWAYSTAAGELMVPFGGRGQSLGRRFRVAMGSYDLFASGHEFSAGSISGAGNGVTDGWIV